MLAGNYYYYKSLQPQIGLVVGSFRYVSGGSLESKRKVKVLWVRQLKANGENPFAVGGAGSALGEHKLKKEGLSD